MRLTIWKTFRGNGPSREIYSGGAWSFKDSWATNITAVGALLTTFLAAVGSSSTILPGIDTTRFAVLSAGWGGLAVFGPIVVALRIKGQDANQPLPVASPRGLCIAGFVTLVAVGGELTTIGVLASLSTISGAPLTFTYIVLLVAGLLTGWYAVCTTQALVVSSIEAQRKAPPGQRASLAEVRSSMASFWDSSFTL